MLFKDIAVGLSGKAFDHGSDDKKFKTHCKYGG